MTSICLSAFSFNYRGSSFLQIIAMLWLLKVNAEPAAYKMSLIPDVVSGCLSRQHTSGFGGSTRDGLEGFLQRQRQ